MQLVLSFLVGTTVGILITVPLGPTSIYIAQNTLNGQSWKGFYVAIGAVITDILYCLVITLGLMSLVSPYLHNSYVQIGLAVLLIAYGIKMLYFDRNRSEKSRPALNSSSDRAERKHFGILMGTTMTLANPTLFLSWTAILSFLSAHSLLSEFFWDKIVFSFSAGFGSMIWFLGVILFVRSRRHSLSPSFIRWASTITAILIIGFGIYFSITIFTDLNGPA